MIMPRLTLLAASIALALSANTAHAVLERVGPASSAPSIGGYPAWYQDATGIALEFCDPKNQAEVDGGWCLLLPGDVTLPEVFPTNFFDEHFWFAGDASMTTAGGAKALLVLALEGAFAADVAPGGQIAFSRIRVVLSPVTVTGTYRIIHPYGEEIVNAVAGARIFVTDDVGIGCPAGQFDCALDSRLGPFLLPSAVPGGAELPPVAGPVPGKLYIADPARSGAVTGSTLPDFIDSSGVARNHNIFRIEGPVGSNLGGPGIDFIETTDFTLVGRLFTNTIAGRIDVDRATYARWPNGQQLDVYASAFPTTQGRLPAQTRPLAADPQLTFYDAPCGGTVDATGTIHPPYSAPVGATETQMFATGGSHWGQGRPLTLPNAVCVKDGSARNVNGVIAPAYSPQTVTDQVSVTQASYDPNAGTLSITATSSDTASPPALSVAFPGFRRDLINGQLVIPGLVSPPAKVRVMSSASGVDEALVSPVVATGAPTGFPLAINDAFSLLEDSGPQTLSPLANDSNVTGGTLIISSPPRLGTAVVNPDGTVTYTPNLNAFGTDAFTYTVSGAGQVSNTGTSTLTILPVNDAPVAVNDRASAIVNVPQPINLLANDTDPDGTADLAAAVNVSGPILVGALIQPVPMPATVTVTGGLARFVAAQNGTYSFTYQAQDAVGALSANTATVTVQVAAGETLTVGRGEYVTSKNQLRIAGTLTPVLGQTVLLEWLNLQGSTLGTIATATPDPTGSWAINIVLSMPVGATSIRATSSNGTVQVGTVTKK